MDSTIGGQHVNGQTFLNVAIQAGVETGASFVAQGIGALPKNTFGDQVISKTGHAANAAVAKMTANVLTGEKAEKDVLAASFGAVVGQMIAEGLTDETAIREAIRKEAAEDGKVLTLEQEQDLYEKAVQKIADISRICAGTISLAIGLDVSSTVVGATVAVENDYKPRTLDKLTTELVARDLKKEGYTSQEAEQVVSDAHVQEIITDLAEAGQELEKVVAKIEQATKSHKTLSPTKQESSEITSSEDVYQSLMGGQLSLASGKLPMETPEHYQSTGIVPERVMATSSVGNALDKLATVYEKIDQLRETFPKVAKVLEASQMLVQARRNAVLAVARVLGYQGPVEAGMNWVIEKGERFVNHHAQQTLGFSTRQADTLTQTFRYGLTLTTGMMKSGKGVKDGKSGKKSTTNNSSKKPIQQMTDGEFVQSLANRANRKFAGKGPEVGKMKHKYAEKLGLKYQEKTGERLDIAFEKRYKAGKPLRRGDGLKDSVIPDAYNTKTGDAWDHKFGEARLGQRQIDKLKEQMPVRADGDTVKVTEVKPVEFQQ